jgi:hypothetical protein
MANTEKIHKLVEEEDDFEEFLIAVNDQRKFYELFVSVEGVGRETGYELDLDTIEEIDHFMVGWMRLLWEAHHGNPDKVREPSFRDVFFTREVG